ncbi:insecticidal delta-endotoxin Cry8Ea1 family protein, partial [Bacillus wiedmannii]|uniref:insecticidal delta-endotoxin Cry8Ea1 family protein n=1 Tax=Bacillus wiedmannii TaxID=1890302 RepID=UPI003D217FF8
MNQNYNNNEYEILDNGGISNQPRYPLAQAPGSEWQNMNYTDWVNRCNCGEPGELFNDTTTAVRNGLIIGTGVGWALLGLIPVIGGPASAIAGLFNVLIPYWWPEQAGNPGTAQAQFTWEQLMSAVETITDKKILNFKKSDAIARWQGIQLLTRDYYLKLCDWINDQTSPSKQAAVKDAFDDVEDYIKISMPFFEAQGFQVQMLSMYAQAASMHLLLLRDVVKYGVGWGYEPYEVERYYSHIGLGNKGLLQLIADYTDHCVVWYNTGLQEQYNTGDWNKFNDFRRDMTIMVLDIVSIWPTFDPRLYTVPTKSQLTRTVYTRVSGDTGGGNITVEPTLPIDVVESNVVDIPRLFSWLRELTIDADNFPSSSPGRFDMKGRGLKRQNTLSNTIEVGGYKGEAGNRQQTLSIPSPQSNDDVWKIDTLIRIAFNDGSRAVNGWDFKFTQSPNQHLYGTPFFPQEVAGFPCKGQNLRPCEPCVSCSSELPDMNVPCNDKSLYSHRYSYMGLGMLTYNSTTPFRYAAYFSNGWTHVSADANNLIDLEKITQIPAVKGYSLTGTSRVIKGPGSTGGDLVKLSASGMLGLAITEPSGTHAYRVRIRYACNMDINILVLNEVTAELGRFIAPATTTDMTNLTYDKFGYLDTLVYSYSSLEDVNNGLNIYNLGSDEATIILDKIEFIPIQGSVETYEADQALEKARKAVNDLFPNDAKNT